jgi:hypothetical protein
MDREGLVILARVVRLTMAQEAQLTKGRMALATLDPEAMVSGAQRFADSRLLALNCARFAPDRRNLAASRSTARTISCPTRN